MSRIYNQTTVRVLVCGGRDFMNAGLLGAWLGGLDNRSPIATIIEGGARGADALARAFGCWKKIPVETFPAEWQRYGKSAGPIRNQRMIDEGKPDIVMAFPGGKGTADMVARARRFGIEVIEVRE